MEFLARNGRRRSIPGHFCRDLVAARLRVAAMTLAFTVAMGVAARRPARACSAPMAPTPSAIPRAGSTEVSTATSIVILSGSQPGQVAVTAGNTPVPVDGVTPMGAGIDGVTGQLTQFWRVRILGPLTILPASTEIVVTAAAVNGPFGGGDAGADGRATLSTFTTAASYDKTPGTPAKVSNLALKRVRYKLSDINAGYCVFAEYHGYISVDVEPAVIPGTPPESVVSTITLEPRNGGAAPQSFTFTGPLPFKGFPSLPGDYPTSSPRWMPDLDPTLEYCVGVTSFGFGDVARLPVRSDTVCATVQQVSVPGAGADGSVDTGAGSDAGTAAASEAGSDWRDESPTAPPDTPVDAAGEAKVPAPSASGGCSISGGASPAGLPTLVLLLALARRKRRA